MSANIKQYFMGSIWFTAVSVAMIFMYGFERSGQAMIGFQYAMLILILGMLEVSLSFDNAVVNAKVLGTMDDVWRKRFVTWGMLIAVFGMRLVFPIAIISVAGHMSPVEAINLAMNDHEKYAEILQSAELPIAGFGGAFLLLVALSFFFNVEKDVHWVHFLESKLAKIGAIKSSEIIVTLGALIGVSYVLPTMDEKFSFLLAGAFGIITHELVKGLGDLLNTEEDESNGTTATVAVAKAGLATFLYLEVLDASFSLDGVIGALVVSKDIFVIALGLGIGAMFVRSLTLMFVAKGTLSEYKFLEHGAFWAILSLAAIMFISVKVHIPEIVTGGLAAALIVASFIGSVISNKSEELNEELGME